MAGGFARLALLAWRVSLPYVYAYLGCGRGEQGRIALRIKGNEQHRMYDRDVIIKMLKIIAQITLANFIEC